MPELEKFNSSYTGAQIDNAVGKALTIPTTMNLIKGNGSGGVAAATPGTDYAQPDVIAIQSAQPTSSTNKLWIKEESGNGIEIPTVAEMQSLIALAFTVMLDDASWSNGAQTVSNANFLASGYGYIVTPASASFADYAAAVIYADNVTVDGSMTFHCTTAPSSDLTVNILRVVSA